jgi:hypothetical protein
VRRLGVVLRRFGLGTVFACLLARCLFPSLDGLSGGADASQSDVASGEAGPIAWVQQSTTTPSPPDASVIMSGAIGAGDTLIVCSEFPIDFGSLSVSDTLGRSWVLLGSQDGIKTTGHDVCFVSIGGPGGNDTIELTTTSSTLVDGAAHSLEAYVFEYQNVSAVDQKLTMVGFIDAGSPIDSGWDGGSIVASAPNELLFAWVEGNSAAHLDPSFTSRTTLNGNNVGDKILDASGTFPITGNANASWTLIAATFKGF